jgi:hypothetical protein
LQLGGFLAGALQFEEEGATMVEDDAVGHSTVGGGGELVGEKLILTAELHHLAL